MVWRNKHRAGRKKRERIVALETVDHHCSRDRPLHRRPGKTTTA